MKCSYQQVKQSVNIDSMTRMSSVCEREREREYRKIEFRFFFSSFSFAYRKHHTCSNCFNHNTSVHCASSLHSTILSINFSSLKEKEREKKRGKEKILFVCQQPITRRRCPISVSLAHPSVEYDSLKSPTFFFVLLFLAFFFFFFFSLLRSMSVCASPFFFFLVVKNKNNIYVRKEGKR